MKLAYLTTLGALALSTTAAHSGGWETGRLDTSFLYEDGNYVELSYGNLNYSVNGTTQAGVTHPMAKDQTRHPFQASSKLEDFDIGLTSFGSGAIPNGRSGCCSELACSTAFPFAAATLLLAYTNCVVCHQALM